jgi:GrpB-like predicted nucleotidyltransferase (UPF0157 family)
MPPSRLWTSLAANMNSGRNCRGLGLPRAEVKLSPWNPEWSEAFASLAKRIEVALGTHARIEHVGSTAVPELPAKPIIDMALLLPEDCSLDRAIGLLGPAGFVFLSDEGKDGGALFVVESAEDIRTAHLHVVSVGDPQWDRWLLFRNALRHDPTVRDAYSTLKTGLAQEYSENRPAYTAAKQEFIESTLANLSTP